VSGIDPDGHRDVKKNNIRQLNEIDLTLKNKIKDTAGS
jgi:hypothetical protein